MTACFEIPSYIWQLLNCIFIYMYMHYHCNYIVEYEFIYRVPMISQEQRVSAMFNLQVNIIIHVYKVMMHGELVQTH